MNKKGFSTLEILIAMAILILTLSAVLLVSFSNQSVFEDSQTSREALTKAQAFLENEQSLARKDFKMVNNVASTTDGIYTEAVYASTTDYFTKTLTSLVSWQGDRNKPENVSLTSVVTDFEDANGGDTCDSILSGNWANPQIININTNFAQLVGDNTGIYPITNLDVYMKRLFVTINGSSLVDGFNSPSTVVNDASIGGFGWTNPNNAESDDNLQATTVLPVTAISNYLEASHFDFAIPEGATILGIKVDIKRSADAVNSIQDNEVKLIKSDNSLGSMNEADASTWSTDPTISTYGSQSDLWGEDWSPDDINSPNFGVAFSVTNTNQLTTQNAGVDYIHVTVTYIKQFYVLDVSNPTKPLLINGLRNNKDVQVGLNAVVTDGHDAYVATDNGKLQIIDVSGRDFSLVSTYSMPGVTGSIPGESIFYKNGYVYLGLAATGVGNGPEFHIIDVHTPSTPVEVGHWPATANLGYAINAILVRGNYAYIATPDTQELITLDISNPAIPLAVGGYDAPDNAGNGKSLYLVGDKLYLGRTTTSSDPELYVLNNTNPGQLIANSLGSKEIGSSVNGLIERDPLAFTITTNGQFDIWNVASTTNIVQATQPLILPNAGTGVTMDCEGNTFFVGSVPSTGVFVNQGSISIISSEP